MNESNNLFKISDFKK